MQHHAIAPPEALQHVIKDIWYISRKFDGEQSSLEVVPDGCAELIFYFGSPCSVATDAGLQPLSSPFLVGLLNQPIHFHAQSHLEIIGIKCFPWAVVELLGLQLRDGVRSVAHPIAQLQAPLAKWLAAGNVLEALAEVARYFGRAWSPRPGDQLLGKAGGAMRAAAGSLPVREVAAAAHATVRTLERKFKQAAGHTVKELSNLMRFEQVRDLIWHNPAANLAGLAQELGYADQAHLGREFKRYSGTTPAAFARKATSWQQTVSTDFVAFVLA